MTCELSQPLGSTISAKVKMDMDGDFDIDLDLDLGLDFDVNTPDPEGVDFTLFDSAAENLETSIEDDSTANKPYHSKRPHKKSRAGCKQCKQRKVKCEEGRPACRACTLRKESCVYPTGASASSSSSKLGKANSTLSRPPRSSREHTPSPPTSYNCSNALVVAEPIFYPLGTTDAVDMKMLWFYTAETYQTFNIEGGHTGAIDTVLRVTIPQLAFQSPFLMQTLMGLSALQLKTLQQEVPAEKVATYRAGAFQGYRSAIELAKPQDFPALLACSLLMCALSSDMFRDVDTKPLYIIDWMTVWRGIGLIVDITSPSTIADSGMAALFYRPPIDLNKSQKWIPNNLLFMVQSIKLGDDDYEHQQTYYEVLRYLGSLYQELETGFSPIMDLRVITFFTFIPKAFIPLAKEFRPRALIIIAHYCAFTKQNLGPWWMKDIGDRQIKEICAEVGDSWEHLLRVPRKVVSLTDRVEIAKTILENDTWTAPDQDLYSPDTRDPRVKQLKMIDNNGNELGIGEGGWMLMSPPCFNDTLDTSVLKFTEDAIKGPTLTITEEFTDATSPGSVSQSLSTLSPAPSALSSVSASSATSPYLFTAEGSSSC